MLTSRAFVILSILLAAFTVHAAPAPAPAPHKADGCTDASAPSKTSSVASPRATPPVITTPKIPTRNNTLATVPKNNAGNGSAAGNNANSRPGRGGQGGGNGNGNNGGGQGGQGGNNNNNGNTGGQGGNNGGNGNNTNTGNGNGNNNGNNGNNGQVGNNNGGNNNNGTNTGNNGGGQGNNNNGGNGGGDPQTSLTLDPKAIATGFANDGQAVPVAGQVASLTSTNNFINFCLTVPQLPLTNGQQVTTGSCNPAPMGIIPSVDNMPSSKFTFPENLSTLKANTQFTISMAISNLDTGFFVNAQANYFSAPQQLNGGGTIQGHSHVVVEQITSLTQATPTNPKVFAFFKGLNGKANGNILTADVTNGLPAGVYRLASINTAANHQPVLGPVAQHGSFDDQIYFTVTDDGQPAGGAGGNNGGNNNGNNGNNNNGNAGNNNANAGNNNNGNGAGQPPAPTQSPAPGQQPATGGTGQPANGAGQGRGNGNGQGGNGQGRGGRGGRN